MSEFFYNIVIKAIVTIMETIQERGVDLTEHRLMDNDMVLLTLCKDITKLNQSLHIMSSETTTELVYRFA